MVRAAVLAFAVSLQPLVSDDVLEPSVRNEVDHALSLAPQDAFASVADAATGDADAAAVRAAAFAELAGIVGTNSLSATETAIRLVSSQRPDGRWKSGTNDVTRAAVLTLLSL